GAGNDAILWLGAGSEVRGGQGADFIAGAMMDELPEPGDEAPQGLVIYGGGGISDAADGGDAIMGSIWADVIYGNGGDDFILGWLGDDVIHGGQGDDVLGGNEGVNTLTGGVGADTFVIQGGFVAPGGESAEEYADNVAGLLRNHTVVTDWS